MRQGGTFMEQLMYILVIAAAMVFGWYLYQKRAAEQKNARAGDAARRPRKPRPHKKR